jgi:NAD(P)-dependent dehydrogenase (short-subunit alcohol dehydrogenase family)
MDRTVSIILSEGSSLSSSVARAAAEAGHRVLLCDPDEETLDKARNELGDAAAYHHDALHTPLGLRNCLAAARENFGRVDQAVMIPALPEPADLDRLEIDDLDRMLGRAARSATLLLRFLREQMREQPRLDLPTLQRHPQRGAVVLILGMAGMLADPGRFSETVTQAALLGVMRAGAVALAGDAIRVNAICAVRPRASREEPWLEARTPLGRAALADEIAQAALFLNASNAGFITGETLVLDGGRSVLNGVISAPT